MPLPSKYYTGVGSRNTPSDILQFMYLIAKKLGPDYFLRSGGAMGADLAFEGGAVFANIYYADDATATTMEMASQYHSAWHKCSFFARKLHGRNVLQILGDDLQTPSEFVICWTPDGATSHQERSIETGGTGTAISVASAYGVPVYNLRKKEHFEMINNWVRRRL
jgi:hypothetical protein